MSLSETSNLATQAAILGQNTANGDGIVGEGRRGVVGSSSDFQGVYGLSQTNAGVVGESGQFHGVYGVSHAVHNGGVYGTNDAGGFGVIGVCPNGVGVQGDSSGGEAVVGVSQTGRGVQGTSNSWQGVYGLSQTNAGVVGESPKFHGIYGVSHDPNNGGVYGTNDGSGFGVIGVSPNGIGVSGKGGKLAARFEGDVEVWGDIRLTNGDCAEEFSVDDGQPVEPGTVMVLCEQGTVRPSSGAYDKRVAGVISGAGQYRPAIVLDKQPDQAARHPIALVGKVYCKVNANGHPIEIGDLLTTSDQPGHAMKAADPALAFGAVIGKALRPLASGCGMIPILVALQ